MSGDAKEPPYMNLTADVRPMRNVQMLEFRCPDIVIPDEENGVQEFCTNLAWLFPNVKRLTLVFKHLIVLECIRKHLHLFKNLTTCKLMTSAF